MNSPKTANAASGSLHRMVRALAKRWKSRITMIQVLGIYTTREGELRAREIERCLKELRAEVRKRPNA